VASGRAAADQRSTPARLPDRAPECGVPKNIKLVEGAAYAARWQLDNVETM
jgi:hypothetical protein